MGDGLWTLKGFFKGLLWGRLEQNMSLCGGYGASSLVGDSGWAQEHQSVREHYIISWGNQQGGGFLLRSRDVLANGFCGYLLGALETGGKVWNA